MAGSTSFDDPNRQRRKSRFDDPNPPKRSSFQDAQDASPFQQSAPNNLHTSFSKPNPSGGNQPDRNVDKNAGLHNVGFQSQFVPQTHPMSLYPPFIPPNPQVFAPFPPHNAYPLPSIHEFTNGQQFCVPKFLLPAPKPKPSHVSWSELEAKEDLDLCDVGVLANILMNIKKKSDFKPYAPIDNPNYIPNKGSTQAPTDVTLEQKNQVEDFYEELEEIFQHYKAEIEPNDVSYNYSRRRKYNLNRQLTQPIKIVSQEDLMNPMKRDIYTTPMSDPFSGVGTEGIGIGSGEDLFESFRRKRSTKYHESYAIRESVRKDPNFIVIPSSELCYSCNKPGHYAKDCKYGIL